MQDVEVSSGTQSLFGSSRRADNFTLSACPIRIRACTGQLEVMRSEVLDFKTYNNFTVTIVARGAANLLEYHHQPLS